MLVEVTSKLEESLGEFNSWWADGVLPEEDSMPRRAFYARFAATALHRPRRAAVLLGPRRVGKTVMLKQLVANCLQKSIPPANICYVSMDHFVMADVDLREIVRVVTGRKNFHHDKPSMFIFDEIQYCYQWRQQLKVLVDFYLHSNIRFVVSGSTISALPHKETESGLGRFAEYYLPYLLFCEFLQLQDSGIDLNVSSSAALLEQQLPAATLATLNEKLFDYISYGAYPELAFTESEQAKAGVVHLSTAQKARLIAEEIVERMLLHDLPREYAVKKNTASSGLFMSLYRNNGRELSLHSLARTEQVSKPTISRYLDFFEAGFQIRKVTNLHLSLLPRFRLSTFKIYFNNPSLVAALQAKDARRITGTDLGTLLQNAVLSQYPQDTIRSTLNFARWQRNHKDYSLDFIEYKPLQHEIQRAIAIKWLAKGEEIVLAEMGYAKLNKQYRSIFSSSKAECLVLTQSEYDRCKIKDLAVTILPVAQFCAAIGFEQISQSKL